MQVDGLAHSRTDRSKERKGTVAGNCWLATRVRFDRSVLGRINDTSRIQRLLHTGRYIYHESAERLTRPLYTPCFFVYTLSDQYREAVRFLLLAPLGTKTGLKPSRDQSQSRPLSFEKGSGPVLFEKNRSHPDTQPRRKTKQTPREEVVCVFPSRKRAAKRTKNQRFKQILGTSSKPGG